MTSRALLDGGVAVSDRLRFHALRRVDHQQRPFAGGQRARYLIAKIDMARRIDKVELIGFTAARQVMQRDAMRLNGDAALALDIHRIEHLCRHFAQLEAPADLNEAIRQRGFTVIDMGDDGKIANVFEIAHVMRNSARLLGGDGIGGIIKRGDCSAKGAADAMKPV